MLHYVVIYDEQMIIQITVVDEMKIETNDNYELKKAM